MQVIYQETDISRYVIPSACTHKNVSHGKADVLEIVFARPSAWHRWQPETDDIIQVNSGNYETGVMYVNTLVPEGDQYRLIATSLPSKAARKAWDSYRDMDLKTILHRLAVEYYPDLYASDAASNPFTQNNGYIALITTEELLFIKAEAQYWAGDKAGAYNTTCEAVHKNFARYGVVEAGLADYDQERIDRFWEVKLPGAATFTIGDLMQQKYVAMYLQPEQWTDLRRYNYSSKTNGIQYDNCYVYTVYTCHNGDNKKWRVQDFSVEYSLRRPYNLYEPYWNTFDEYGDYGKNAELSPNAWINRLNADTETETKYNKGELDRIGYYTTNAAGEKVLDYRVLKRRLIWAKNTCGKAVSSDPDIVWQ